MNAALSPNTQAILLLTAPLIAGRGDESSDLLTPGEYKRLARFLRDEQRQPADLLAPGCRGTARQRASRSSTSSASQRLLGRGFLLSQAIERWQARAIWVVSRADAEYPDALKARLREDCTAVLYGCGDVAILRDRRAGGRRVAPRRRRADRLHRRLAGSPPSAARTLVSGGARGIDQAAMRGALEAGGKVAGVLADSLERAAMNREHRNLLMERTTGVDLALRSQRPGSTSATPCSATS